MESEYGKGSRFTIDMPLVCRDQKPDDKIEVEGLEVLVVDDDKMRLIKTEYSSYGVGLPFLPEEGSLEIKDGKMILKTDRSFKNINMVISPIAKHYLRVNGKKYSLSDDILGNKPTKISITIK